ncbi:abortive infection family protein [Boseaceae bacterium BT-24-1]|nr:abortive infection family protein [Boseaceae bacterium BT-24-1]
MVSLKHSEMRVIDDAFDMNGGYVLDFSDRTMSEFFDDEFSINIYDEIYRFNGSSKAKHLRAFVATEDEYIVARVLRRLWEYRENSPRYPQEETSPKVKERLFALIDKIEGSGAVPSTDALERFVKDETLDELIAALNRDIGANKPQAALDRLHTYCMKKFGHLLDTRGVVWDRSEPLHSRIGRYVKALEQERELRDVTKLIVKSAIGIFEKYNHVRNNRSLAHDNELLHLAEARFIYDAVTAFLRFVKSVEANRFGA